MSRRSTGRPAGQPRTWLAVIALGLIVAACVTVPRGDKGASTTPAPMGSATPSAAAASFPAGSSALPTASAPFRSEQPSIGYISLDESQVFVQAVSAGIRQAADAAGIDLIECDSGWTREGVQACAGQLAAAGVHGVISFQPFADLAAGVCETTGDAPTIGIVYDQGPCQISLLAIDQAESGRLAGAAMGAFAAERWDCDVKAWVSLGSGSDDPIGGARMDGFRDGYQEHCALPSDTRALADAQHMVTARTQVATALGKIKGKPILVAGVSDIAILGAMQAATDAGRANQVWYGGQLADPEVRAEIACNDHYIASVAQLPEHFGTTLVPALIEAMAGGEVAPRIDAALEVVTAANVRTLFPDTPACDE